MLWSQTSGGAYHDYGSSVTETSDGGYALAGTTESFGAGEWDFWLIKLAPSPTAITATVDIHPTVLNLWSRGRWVSAYIELPQGYNPSDIDVSSIRLNDTIPAELGWVAIGDYDRDDIPDLMVKFDKAQTTSYILSSMDTTELDEGKFMTVTLTVTGKLNDGTAFEGSDTIKVIYTMPKGLGRGIFPI